MLAHEQFLPSVWLDPTSEIIGLDPTMNGTKVEQDGVTIRQDSDEVTYVHTSNY